VAAGQPGGTWCAKVVGTSLSSAQTFGLAAFPNLAPPALAVSTLLSDNTPAPGQTLYLYTTLVNEGSAAPGSYARVTLPAGFSLLGARVFAADGRSLNLAPSEMYFAGGAWHFAVGQVNGGFPRLVRWAIQVDQSTSPGAYQFAVDANCRCGGPQASGGTGSIATMVFVGGYSVYLPLAGQ
jgi:hypothetical protein